MMNYFGLTPEELERKGAHWTAREIAQQPRLWQEIERLVHSEAAQVSAFLEPLLRMPNLRIVLTGAGTSAFIGECLAPALMQATPSLMSSPLPCSQPALVNDSPGAAPPA